MNNNIHILLIEDELKISEVVTSFLKSLGYQVSPCENGREALALFQARQFDLVLLDLMLPDMSGEDICQKLRRESDVPIIMVTAKVQEEDLLRGLQIGADDYIRKPFSLKELSARIESLLRRSRIADQRTPQPKESAVFSDGQLEINFDTFTVKLSGKEVFLTPYEFRLLSGLARHPKKVFEREELIELTLGLDYRGFDRTIDSHIKNLRKKIESDPKNPRYVKTVRGVGYAFGGSHE